jgi:hypothetical protein
MLNRSFNYSSFPINPNNENISDQFSLFFPITIGISSIIGTIFSILSLIRYFRERGFRSYFNYIYHNMLIFCLINSIIYVPSFYVGVYLSWFIIFPIFCTIFLIHSYAIFAGLAYLLMWSSLEQHIYYFRINRSISYCRQILPLIIVVVFVYLCSILIVLLPKCSKEKICEACFMQNFLSVILFTLYTFFIPILIMICSTIILLWRLFKQRTKLNKHRRWIRLKRMFYQAIIYLGWYCLAYWPYTIYSLLISYDSNRFYSVILKSTSYLISIYGIQTLPILTYFIFKSNKKSRQNKYVMSNIKDIKKTKQQKWNIKWLKNKKQPTPIVERF